MTPKESVSLTAFVLFMLIAKAVGQGTHFFESAPDCGFPDASGLYAKFESRPEVLSAGASLGVCGLGVPGLEGRSDRCVSCTFVPASGATCPGGWALVNDTVWQLAPATSANCHKTGCQISACGDDEVEAESVVCDLAAVTKRVRTCCRQQAFHRCCRLRPCTDNGDQPVGQCAVGGADLLPGQTAISLVFAVSAASTSCSAYSFPLLRTCGPHRAFAAAGGHFFDRCQVLPPERDAAGCPLAPGYTFHRRALLPAGQALLHDNTDWARLHSDSVSTAGSDTALMASRCEQ